MKYKQTDLAWAAGIVDGEGYIGIVKLNSGLLNIRIQIEMKHKPTIKKLFSILKAGHVKYNSHPNNKRNKWSDVNRLAINHTEAVKILKLLLPYMITKKQQTILALKFEKDRDKQNNAKKLPQFIRIKRLKFYNQMKSLNKRGI